MKHEKAIACFLSPSGAGGAHSSFLALWTLELRKADQRVMVKILFFDNDVTSFFSFCHGARVVASYASI